MIEVMTQLPSLPLISIDCDQLMYQDDPMLTCLNDAAAAAAGSSSSAWNGNSNATTWDRFTPASSDEWLSDLYNYNPNCTSFSSSPGL